MELFTWVITVLRHRTIYMGNNCFTSPNSLYG